MGAPTEVKGRLWKVEIERRQSAFIYVLSDTGEQALADAAELVADQDFFDMDDDSAATRVPTSAGQVVWSGGPDGQWTGPFEGA